MGEQSLSCWHSQSLQLPIRGSVLCADVAADSDATLRVVAVTEDNQSAMQILSISGDPTLGKKAMGSTVSLCHAHHQHKFQMPSSPDALTLLDVGSDLNEHVLSAALILLCSEAA